jgi:hypothetical protein
MSGEREISFWKAFQMIDELLLDYKILLKNLLQMFANGVYMKKLVIKYSHSVHLVFDIRHSKT